MNNNYSVNIFEDNLSNLKAEIFIFFVERSTVHLSEHSLGLVKDFKCTKKLN